VRGVAPRRPALGLAGMTRGGAGVLDSHHHQVPPNESFRVVAFFRVKDLKVFRVFPRVFKGLGF
jgi:hypothetical protein